MSAESGIATFRDSGGLWEQHPVEQVATPEGFAANPELVQEFYNHRRRELLNAKPNAGHQGLAEMEKDFEVYIITQNVDDLHERAGSTNVLHLHGELMKVRSTGDPSLIYEVDPSKPDIRMGDKCEKGFQLRPHIVLVRRGGTPDPPRGSHLPKSGHLRNHRHLHERLPRQAAGDYPATRRLPSSVFLSINPR